MWKVQCQRTSCWRRLRPVPGNHVTSRSAVLFSCKRAAPMSCDFIVFYRTVRPHGSWISGMLKDTDMAVWSQQRQLKSILRFYSYRLSTKFEGDDLNIAASPHTPEKKISALLRLVFAVIHKKSLNPPCNTRGMVRALAVAFRRTCSTLTKTTSELLGYLKYNCAMHVDIHCKCDSLKKI